MEVDTISQQTVAKLRVPYPLREDALSVATLAILESTRTFDPERNVPDGAWAAISATFAVRKFLTGERGWANVVAAEQERPAPDPYMWIVERSRIDETLNGREKSIVYAMAYGYPMADVSRRFRTSSNEIRRIREKLGTKNRA